MDRNRSDVVLALLSVMSLYLMIAGVFTVCLALKHRREMAQQAHTALAWDLTHRLVSDIEAYRWRHNAYPEDLKDLNEPQYALVRRLHKMGCAPVYWVDNDGPCLGVTIEGEQYWTYYFNTSTWDVHSQYWSPIHQR